LTFCATVNAIIHAGLRPVLAAISLCDGCNMTPPAMWGREGDRREVQKGGDICVFMADPC